METKEKPPAACVRSYPCSPLSCSLFSSTCFGAVRPDGRLGHPCHAPAEQLLGRLSAPLPFSLAEVLVTVFLTACALCLIRGTVLAVRLHAPHELGRRLVCLLCALLWVWTGLLLALVCGLLLRLLRRKERSGDPALHRVHPGPGHAVLCLPGRRPLHPRWSETARGHFAEDLDDCFRRGVSVYEELEQKLPCLAMPPCPASPCSSPGCRA